MDKGIKASEFYLTLGTLISSMLVMTGILVPERAGEVGELIAQAIGGIVAIVALLGYILSRTELKKTQLQQDKNLQG